MTGLRPGATVDELGDDYDRFFRAEQPRLVAVAMAMGCDADAARDIAQETMVRAYQRWPEVRLLDRPGGWARRVAVNLAISGHRRRTREDRTLTRAAARSGSDGSSAAPADPVSDHFWTVVRQLPERQRAVVALHYLDDLPLAEIADILDCAEGTVKSLLFKARTKLADRLAAEVA